ncbi:Pantothenic acid transporter PanT [Caloramator mitchellensis]|uniref:Pantothenic acid transporter PanT n=1 Tax=Caloramator mitchellensis TaxID=908809 RepID=A0A0R3JSR1_CALMK|nr:ECF transporter S component [Caloramator mitchellensis]KRQ86551.1 Pantothenic acid transporter PanT [Caloramator mitchellensis]
MQINTQIKSQISVKKLTRIALLSAIAIFMSFTPFGYIQLGAIRITFMHIPVIIAAIVEGMLGGIIVGLIFGVSSLISNLSGPLAPVFINPLVSIFPRIMIGIVSSIVYKKSKNASVTAALGTITNTVLVLSMIYFFAASAFSNIRKIAIETLGKFLLIIALKNGILEMLVAVIIVTAVVKALNLKIE